MATASARCANNPRRSPMGTSDRFHRTPFHQDSSCAHTPATVLGQTMRKRVMPSFRRFAISRTHTRVFPVRGDQRRARAGTLQVDNSRIWCRHRSVNLAPPPYLQVYATLSNETLEGANRLPQLWEQYLALGFSIIPIKPGSKSPLLDSWKEYSVRRATREEVEGWLAKWPDCGWAIITGKVSGVVGFDCDEASLQPPLPATLTCRTGKGRHYYYRLPPGATVRTHKIEGLPGLDTLRGEGSYLIAPPSVHPSTGAIYAWETPFETLADLPESFTPKRDWQSAQRGAESGTRNDSITAYIGKLLRSMPQ